MALLLSPQFAAAEAPDFSQTPLQLDVRINGYALDLVAAFVQMPDGRIGSPQSELTEIGIAAPAEGPPDQIIVLDSIPGVTYVYDDASQSIAIQIPNAARLPKKLDASRNTLGDLKPKSGTGLVVNYSAFSAADYRVPDSNTAIDGGSLSLDARAYSNLGTLRQTGILGTTTFSQFTALRLDSTWSYSDPDSLRTYRIGDIVSGGLGWTRPIRLGGAQVQRNFELRPDLITMPLPQLAGTAEVPSTLSVFINGMQSYSSDLQPGPFTIDNLPVYTSSGTARMVLTDSTGRQSEAEEEFYTSPDLLKKKLYDFSAESGVVRRDFGTESFGYGDMPVALGSLRYGITNFLTGETHAEFSGKLADFGGGGLFSAGRLGLFSAAGAVSHYNNETGFLVHGSWEEHIGDFGINLSTSRTFGNFNDLAAVTAKVLPSVTYDPGVPKALDQASFTYAFPKLSAGVGLSLIHLVDHGGERSYIVNGSYSQTFSNNITASVAAFASFGAQHDYGAFIGFSMPFGERTTMSANGSIGNSGWTAETEASRTSDGTGGSYGWRVAHAEGDNGFTAASGTYYGTKAKVQGNISEQNRQVTGNVSVDGSLVVAGGGLFLGNQINDSFAIVDAGAPNVTVEYENRYAGKTDTSGRLLLPDLRSFQRNKIAIDVTDLPLNAQVGDSETYVMPRDMSGVTVDFGVKPDAAAALVILNDAQGKFLPQSSEVTLDGVAEPFLLGYDGQVYLTGLSSTNRVIVKHGDSQCQTSFSYKEYSQNQTVIGPLKCL